MNWQRITGLLLLGAGLTVLTLKLSRTYDPAPAVERLSAKNPRIAAWVKQAKPERIVYGGLVILPACLGGLFLWLSLKAKPKDSESAAVTEPVAVVSKPTTRKAGRVAIQSCNVLQTGAQARYLWQFDARSSRFTLKSQQASPTGQPLPAGLVAKDWRNLFQRKLNVAWLPPEQVFLRVAQLPRSEFSETLAMVELQLEKLSPLPVGQIVWSLHVLPHSAGELQTVIVIIVGRNIVEEFLGQLEAQGYLADCLELPLLDQLQAVPISEDGAWIYPDAVGGAHTALTAWWSGGVLQNLDLINLPATNRPASVREQLTQMAWAGELAGWLSGPPRWHLVANGAVAAEWETALREGLDQPVAISEPLALPQLAALTARRATQAEPHANLLPIEFSTRYQQQFVDRLWMRGLFAIAAVYLAGVLVYMVALQFAVFRTSRVENLAAGMSGSYTNALQVKARLDVLKDRQELKFAALDCWQAVAEKMPDSLSLDALTFADGHRLTLNGSAPSDRSKDVTDFESSLRKSIKGDQQLFDGNKGDSVSFNKNSSAGMLSWNFSLELKRVEVQ